MEETKEEKERGSKEMRRKKAKGEIKEEKETKEGENNGSKKDSREMGDLSLKKRLRNWFLKDSINKYIYLERNQVRGC